MEMQNPPIMKSAFSIITFIMNYEQTKKLLIISKEKGFFCCNYDDWKRYYK